LFVRSIFVVLFDSSIFVVSQFAVFLLVLSIFVALLFVVV
jgi:hypothetical protein